MSRIRVTVTFDLEFKEDPKGVPELLGYVGWSSLVAAGMPTEVWRELGLSKIIHGKRTLKYLEPTPKRGTGS